MVKRVDDTISAYKKGAKDVNEKEVEVARGVLEKLLGRLLGVDGEKVVQSYGVFGKKLITPAHVVKDIDDLTTLKGFSGDWIVQHKPSGDRMLIEKRGKSIEPRVPNTISKDLKDMKGDFTLDAYLDDETLNVVDLLVHKGTDLSFEPLEDRINVLRTLYHSTDNIHFPAPSNCVNSDDEGLVKAIASFDRGEFLIRDATSTFKLSVT